MGQTLHNHTKNHVQRPHGHQFRRNFDSEKLMWLELMKLAPKMVLLIHETSLNFFNIQIFGNLESVELGFGENYPLSMNFTFHDGAAEVKYFLAPRVESEY